MREIKFRAWDGGKMYEPFTLQMGLSMTETALRLNPPGWLFSVKNIYMQFTGLQDKNGKDIYEDDLVKHNDNVFVVAYRDNMGMCFIDMKKFDGGKDLVYNRDNWRDWLWVYNVRKYLEVVGNIHEL